jgi:hypothetical protein
MLHSVHGGGVTNARNMKALSILISLLIPVWTSSPVAREVVKPRALVLTDIENESVA